MWVKEMKNESLSKFDVVKSKGSLSIEYHIKIWCNPKKHCLTDLYGWKLNYGFREKYHFKGWNQLKTKFRNFNYLCCGGVHEWQGGEEV